MVCPCCGGKLTIEARICECGARFVGEPLIKPHTQVKRFGPVMWAYTIFFAVLAAALIFTKWLALGAVLVLWTARRAMNLSRQNGELYGGLRAATGLLLVTAIAGSAAGGYAISYIPRYLDNYQAYKDAVVLSEMHRIAARLEEHRLAEGTYPPESETGEKILGQPMPVDYWGNRLKYEPFTESYAGAYPPNSYERNFSLGSQKVVGIRKTNNPVPLTSIPINNFIVRSAGADGKFNTSDDIVMRDGIVISSLELKK